MNIFLNDISFFDIRNCKREAMPNILMEMANSLRIINLSTHANDMKLIGIKDSFLHEDIIDNYKLIDFIKSLGDKDAKGMILSRLTNYQKVDNIDQINADFSISFFSKEEWRDIITPLCDHNEAFINIKNIPCLKFSTLQKTIARANILTHFLVNSDFVNINSKYISLFYSTDFENEFIQLCRTSQETKRGVISTLSDLILKLSDYTKDSRLSRLNQRPIFYNESINIYISPDYLHGTFELLDNRGRHKGEINYKGECISPADTTGNHNIRMN